MSDVKLILSPEEKIECLNEIIKRIKKIIYVYEKSLEDSNYNYKIFVSSIMLYVSSANYLFDEKLTSILINLNSIFINNLDKKQLKSIVFETLNNARYLLSKEKGESYNDL